LLRLIFIGILKWYPYIEYPFSEVTLYFPNCYVISNINIGALLLQAQPPPKALLVETPLVNKCQVHLDWLMGVEFLVSDAGRGLIFWEKSKRMT
jgi:hypothetical protein